jgi:N-acetylmuramoyl-L-alanine amidase
MPPVFRYNFSVRWWVGGAFLIAAGVTAASPRIVATTQITPELRASLAADATLEVVVTPHGGDAWSRLAKRVTGDGERWHLLADLNHASDRLTPDMRVRVPFALLRPELQKQIAKTLFPNDRATAGGWQHIVIGGAASSAQAATREGESLWNIAEWFTGEGANYLAVRKANPAQGLSTRNGDVILIPKELLTAAFRNEVPRAPKGATSQSMEDVNAPKATEVRKTEDDPVERAAENANAPVAAVEAVAGGVASLTYVRNTAEPYAIYRLQKGEALYSSVAIRFTGRVYAKDVGDVLERLVKFNGIDDVSRIPVSYPVRIPLELLLPEYLPADDPTRVASEEAKRESAKLARRTHAAGLFGVTVILDAGHGGRDAGTTHDGVWESSYVYDVMCRLKRILETKTAARVAATTASKGRGYDIEDDDWLSDRTDHTVLTSPQYTLDDDPTVGVNLRWYLANSIFRRAIRKGAPKEKVVFLSIHADSLHPSLRGAMVYIPGERYVTGAYQKTGDVYFARAEVREHPVVRHDEKESLAAEGLSRDLAESVVDAFESKGLKVHPFNPVRDNVVRNGREWVPAVIRYNVVPTRLLLEVCNLGNEKDRKLMTTKAYRQHVAEAVVDGLRSFFDEDEDAPAAPKVASKGR